MKISFKSMAVAGGLATAMVFGVMVGQGMAAQPHMKAAFDFLQSARSELQSADADKGGHRAKAIEAVNAALGETKAGMEYAATH